MPVTLSKADARRLLAHYHFTQHRAQQADAKTVLRHLGSVQFDPLNPVGRNHDLVLQARVPAYQVGDWQTLAYQERFLYDAWDKQASLVLMQDYPVRRIYHTWHAARWREKVLDPYKDSIPVVLNELQARGPLTSQAFEHQPHVEGWEGSWYGPKLTKNILRGLWHTGRVVTHSRKNGHHVYDLAERVIPPELYTAELPSERESTEWLIKLRHQAVGLLRPNASAEVWSLGIRAPERKRVIADLVSRGELVPVLVDGVLFHALPGTLALLDTARPTPDVVFTAPLDPLLWDRGGVGHVFGFDYVWEVYKPVKARKWGYYVLPVFYQDKFVARFDSRLKEGVWELYSWYWEVEPDSDLLAALAEAVRRFKIYLMTAFVKLPAGLDNRVRAAWEVGQ